MNSWHPFLYKRKAPPNISKEKLDGYISIANSLLQKNLPPILTLGHLAFHTEISYYKLHQYVMRKRKFYKTFKIRKRSRGYRYINIPTKNLLLVQQWINQFILSNVEDNPYSYAFQKGKSIKDCAEIHLGCQWLIKIDMRQFFESVSEINVYKYFLSLGYTKLVSFELARICTITHSYIDTRKIRHYWKVEEGKYSIYQNEEIGHLPQGAPTSPMLANCIFRDTDYELAALAEKYGMLYSRYADDIAFSTKDKNFNKELAKEVICNVYNIVAKKGYSPNHQKTVVSRPGTRKIVLGLLVDGNKVRLQKSFKSNLECHLYFIKKNFVEHARRRRFETVYGMMNHILGLLAYAKYIEPKYYAKLDEKGLIPSRSIL